MASDITITALTAVGMVGQIAATVMASSPASMSCLPYMQPAKVDIYIAATNNFASATLAGTVNSAVGVLMVDGLPELATRYLWAIPKDPDGNAGARYPAGSGVSVTTKATVPDGSVTTPKLADGAATNAKLANLAVGSANIQNLAVKSQHVESLAADKLTAGTVTVTISFTSPIINGGTITGSTVRTAASGQRLVLDGPGGSFSSYDASNQVRASIGAGIANSGVFYSRADYTALYCLATTTSADAHGLRAQNTGSGGGHAVLGISAGGGGWALNAQTGGVYSAGGYHPFTGMHECLVRKNADLAVGDIAMVKRIIARDGLDNVLAEVGRSACEGDRRVIGIVSKRREIPLFSQIAALGVEPRDRELATPIRRHLSENYDLVTVNALGEGQMDVCGRGGDIGAGDYIVSSDLPGKGQRLDMDQPVTFGLQAAIVAQTMEPVTFDSPDQVRRVAVFYRCG